MTTIVLTPRLPEASDSLKLSDGRCARWFIEALQLFRQFDETSSREPLQRAKSILEQCVKNYPQDVLPTFYLAIAASILGDLEQVEPVKIFERFSNSDQFAVRSASQYNLAEAYIETYDLKLYDKAKSTLIQLTQELKSHGAKIGISEWVFRIYALFTRRRVRAEPLYYQALEALTYVRIYADVWEPRWRGEPAKLAAAAQKQLDELLTLSRAIRKHQRFLGGQDGEIWAWHWNNVGLAKEALAVCALRTGQGELSSKAADAAAEAYIHSLRAAPGFGSAQSNLGRLYLEVTQDLDKAADAFKKTLSGAEDTDYTHYNLGIVRTLQGDRQAALEEFKNAPNMLKRRGHEATWTGARKMAIRELRKWGSLREALQLLRALADEHPTDQDVQDQIRELAGQGS